MLQAKTEGYGSAIAVAQLTNSSAGKRGCDMDMKIDASYTSIAAMLQATPTSAAIPEQT